MRGIALFSCVIAVLLNEAAANNNPVVSIENDLVPCVQVTAYDVVQLNNLTLLNAAITVNQSIGYCGCKSAIARYHLYSEGQHLRSETITLKNSTNYSFVLASDNCEAVSQMLQLQLSCGSN